MTASASTAPVVRPADLPRPPIWQAGVAALILVVVSVIYLASYLPGKPNTTPAYVMLTVAAVLVLGAVTLLYRIDEFAWTTFSTVAAWSLLAYIVIGGMIEYVFLRNHTRGVELHLLTFGLVLFTVDVPLLLGFCVARYQQPD
jgi:hypothetical protein